MVMESASYGEGHMPQPPVPNDQGAYIFEPSAEVDTLARAEHNATVTGKPKPVHYHPRGEVCNVKCLWVHPDPARRGVVPLAVAATGDQSHFETARAQGGPRLPEPRTERLTPLPEGPDGSFVMEPFNPQEPQPFGGFQPDPASGGHTEKPPYVPTGLLAKAYEDGGLMPPRDKPPYVVSDIAEHIASSGFVGYDLTPPPPQPYAFDTLRNPYPFGSVGHHEANGNGKRPEAAAESPNGNGANGEASVATRMVFLATPIDFVKPQEMWNQHGPTIAAHASAALSMRGWCVYRPAQAFEVAKTTAPDARLESINRHAIVQCDGVVALLPGGTKSVGVPMEIDRAASLGIPVAVITDAPDSWALKGLPDGLVRVYRARPGVMWDSATMAAVSWLSDRAQPRAHRMQISGGTSGPIRHHSSDAGYDLYVSRRTVLSIRETKDVPTESRVAFPDGYWGMIVGRSSTVRSRGLHVNPGVIDGGWRGDLYALTTNLSEKVQTIEAGERIAQLIPMPLAPSWGVEFVDELRPGDRGERGFGSTGA